MPRATVWLCIHMYAYIHTNKHTYIHTYTHTHIHTNRSLAILMPCAIVLIPFVGRLLDTGRHSQKSPHHFTRILNKSAFSTFHMPHENETAGLRKTFFKVSSSLYMNSLNKSAFSSFYMPHENELTPRHYAPVSLPTHNTTPLNTRPTFVQ